MTSELVTVTVPGLPPTDVRITTTGAGHPVLLLHGGAGPMSVTGFGELLAAERPARVVVPAHPGFDGTDRPAGLTTIRQLAAAYAGLLAELDLTGVTVVGNSIGGWIAAELGLLGSPRVGRVVIIDAVGIEVPGHPVADVFALTWPQVAELSYADPDAFRIEPATLPEPVRDRMAANRSTLGVYAPTMTDPTLRARLSGMPVPALVVWGDADGIADPTYGRAYADATPGARFLLLPRTGHLPQLESPRALLDPLWEFVTGSQ